MSRLASPTLPIRLLDKTQSNLTIMTLSEHPIDTPPRAPSPVHRFGTLAVHAGSPHDPVTGAVIEPVCFSRASSKSTANKYRFHSQPLLHKPVLESQSASTSMRDLRTQTETTSNAQWLLSSTLDMHSLSVLAPQPQPTSSSRLPQDHTSYQSQTSTAEHTVTLPR